MLGISRFVPLSLVIVVFVLIHSSKDLGIWEPGAEMLVMHVATYTSAACFQELLSLRLSAELSTICSHYALR